MQSNLEGERGISKELNLALYPLRTQRDRERANRCLCVWVSERERDNLKHLYNHFRILFISSQKRSFWKFLALSNNGLEQPRKNM